MDIVDPNEPLERQNTKLRKIVQALMQRAEAGNSASGLAYAQFERAALLEAQVRERTADLERTMDLLHETNQRLADANIATERAWSNLTEATETIPDGLGLFDANDRLVLFNSRFCSELDDVAHGIFTGQPFETYVEVVSHSSNLDLTVHGSRQAWVAWRLEQHRKGQVLFNNTLVDDRLMQVSSRRTASGSTVIMHTDVTAVVRLERLQRDRLIDQQAILLRATLNHLDQGVCIFDSASKLVGWNSRLDTLLALPTGHSSRGLHVSDLLAQLDGQIDFTGGFSFERFRDWADQPKRRPPIAFEVKRGARRVLNVFGQEMPDHGFVISFTDVTVERETANKLFQMNEQLEARVKARTEELGQALAAAERANASKSRFVAAASHDLLQPLSAAKLFISSLAEGEKDQQRIMDVAQKAETSLQNGEQIIEALLDISKLDAPHPKIDRRPVPLNAVLTTLKNELETEALDKGLDLRVLPCSLVVESDPGYLRRIVQNLMSNALRYTQRGKVLVGVRRLRGAARIEVWDTGLGLSDADQAVMFEEFRQLDPGGAAAPGLGLGLAIVERACAALDHPLRVQSVLAQGSCFSLEVPVLPDFVPRRPVTAPATSYSADLIEGLVVVLVENDTDLSRALAMLIEDRGGIVLEVANARAALELLGDVDLEPDAVVLDYHLDGGPTGVDVLEVIRRTVPDLPGCLISADRAPSVRQTCADHDVLLLPKPIVPGDLLGFLGAVAAAKDKRA
ncbi:MAG: PAS-domain containing protein [Sedimentitalea sp.]